MELTNRNIVKVEHSLNTARYSLTPVETDLILKMVAEIKNEDEDFKPYSFKVTDLEAYFGKKLNRQTLKEMARNLMKKPLTIDQENGGFLVCNWVSSFVYEPKDGTIELQFSPYLKPYLIQLKDEFFLKGDLRQILQLPSEYAKRIYMLLKQWETAGKLEVEIAEWQRILEVPKSKLSFGLFKQSILTPAINHINEKTDLTVSFTTKKTGRKITHLIWKIRTKPSTRRDELPKFKKWFLREFEGYSGLLYSFNEGDIFLNEKGYFYDGMNKKRRFEEDEIERIWQQLLDRREDLKARKEVWEAWKEKQKELKEAPLPFIDAEEDDSPNVVEYTKEEAEELGAFEETALSEEDAIEASKPSNSNGFIKGIFKRIVGK